jgi:hypothetical protein
MLFFDPEGMKKMNIEGTTSKKITKAKRHHYSMFNVGRSMFDVHLFIYLD